MVKETREKRLRWNELLDRAVKYEDGSRFTLFAGGSGAGKTALIETFKRQGGIRPGAIIIEPELVFRLHLQMPGDLLTRHPEMDPSHKDTYHVIRDAMVMDCLQRGIDVALIDHGHDLTDIQTLMKRVTSNVPMYHSKRMTSDISDSDPPEPTPYIPPESELVGIFLDKERYTKMFKFLHVKRTDMTTDDFEFMISSAQGFKDNFIELTELFDATVLYQNHYTHLERIRTFVKDNGIVKHDYIYDEGYERFIHCNFEEIIRHAFEIATIENIHLSPPKTDPAEQESDIPKGTPPESLDSPKTAEPPFSKPSEPFQKRLNNYRKSNRPYREQ
jgi:hypothetical protein